jgi:molybdate transport system substrate-binding protein
MIRLPSFLLGICAAFLLVLGSQGFAAESVTVFAAASLKDALDDVAKTYEQDRGVKIVVSYAASSALAKQIELGAPADLFISADLDWMDYLEARKQIKSESRKNLLQNRLVLIAPADSKAKVEIGPKFPLARLLGDNRLAMADPAAVPAGKYGKASLEALGVWKEVEPKVAPAENVRAALALVSHGETPFGIVYRTDALADKKVRIVGEFPESTHAPIIYPGALVASSSNPAAPNFLTYLGSPAARAVFEKYGF